MGKGEGKLHAKVARYFYLALLGMGLQIFCVYQVFVVWNNGRHVRGRGVFHPAAKPLEATIHI